MDTSEDAASAAATATHMWVLPRDTVGKGTMWVVLKENAFFELLQSKAETSYFWSAVSNVAKMVRLPGACKAVGFCVGCYMCVFVPNKTAGPSRREQALHAKSSYQPSKYRIVIKNDSFHAIAVADERADIEGYWDWIDAKILPTLSKEDADRTQMLIYLRDKFTAKAQDVDQMERIDNAYFHSTFDLPEETL